MKKTALGLFFFLLLASCLNGEEGSTFSSNLPNGLSYYIHKHSTQPQHASLRLVVKVGSVHEEEGERGVAHFVEHMAFKGSKNFPSQEALDTLASMGAVFGIEVNAFTAFDRTLFVLDVPLLKKGAVRTSLEILADWAFHLSMDDEEIEKEREVIIDENRRRLTSTQKIKDLKWISLVSGSLYAKRLPIGLPKVVRNVTAERVRNFYHKWYRPERMAVIVSGDVDAKAVEKMIRSIFTTEKREPLEERVTSLPSHNTVRYFSSVSHNIDQNRIEWIFKHSVKPLYSRDWLQDRLFFELFRYMVKERIDERDDTFVLVTHFSQQKLASTFFTIFDLSARKGKGSKAIRELAELFQIVERFGFSKGEFERAKASVLLDQELLEMYRSSWQMVAFEEHFLGRRPHYDILKSVQVKTEFLREISLELMNDWTDTFFQTASPFVAVRSSKQEVIKRDQFRQMIKAASLKKLEPYQDPFAAVPLIKKRPDLGDIAKGWYHPEEDITEYRLKSGMRLFLKPTKFTKGEIIIDGHAKGGFEVQAPAAAALLKRNAYLCKNMGLGGHSRAQLAKLLSGKQAKLELSYRKEARGLRLKSRGKDLEVAFELLYLLFNPAGGGVSDHLHSKGELSQLCHAAYSDPSVFTLFIIGDFKLDRVKELIHRYLAPL